MIQIFWEVTPCAWFVKGDTYTIGLLSMSPVAELGMVTAMQHLVFAALDPDVI